MTSLPLHNLHTLNPRYLTPPPSSSVFCNCRCAGACLTSASAPSFLAPTWSGASPLWPVAGWQAAWGSSTPWSTPICLPPSSSCWCHSCQPLAWPSQCSSSGEDVLTGSARTKVRPSAAAHNFLVLICLAGVLLLQAQHAVHFCIIRMKMSWSARRLVMIVGAYFYLMQQLI